MEIMENCGTKCRKSAMDHEQLDLADMIAHSL